MRGRTPRGDCRPYIQYSRPMTTWEYLTAPVLVHSTKQILDNFGADGWELVQIVPGMNPENLVAYFKRPVNG